MLTNDQPFHDHYQSPLYLVVRGTTVEVKDVEFQPTNEPIFGRDSSPIRLTFTQCGLIDLCRLTTIIVTRVFQRSPTRPQLMPKLKPQLCELGTSE